MPVRSLNTKDTYYNWTWSTSPDRVRTRITVIMLLVTSKVASNVQMSLQFCHHQINVDLLVRKPPTFFFFCISQLIKIHGYVKPNTAAGELWLCWQIHRKVLDITCKLCSVISSCLHSTECSFCAWWRVKLFVNRCTEKSISLLLCYVITVIM